MFEIQGLPQYITAIGGLGTAAFGLVDATKPVTGVNHIGFSGIRAAVTALTPSATGPGANAMPPGKLLATLQANWINGTDLGSQKSIAKSLIKLNLSAGNASAVAAATGVDSVVLTAVATSIAEGTPLSSTESDVYGRFDLIVTALLDEAYQRSDQVYRNWTRALAGVVAVLLSVTGWLMLYGADNPKGIGTSVLIGLLATPLAPIAKDLTSALASAVNTLQLVRK
jgi:hypothetical protein